MGYHTTFIGDVEISPPLSQPEVEFLKRFNNSRRMNRTLGPYHARPGENFGQRRDPDVIDYNTPGFGQPGLWCNWETSTNGGFLAWDGREKFSYADRWMLYLIETFFKPGAVCLTGEYEKGWERPAEFDHFVGHILNGTIEAYGEDRDDRWRLVVVENVVTRQSMESIVWTDPKPVALARS